MLNDIGESTIERDQHAAFGHGHSEQPIIRSTCQLLVPSNHYIVTSIPKNRPNRVRNILIKFDRWHSYAAGIGTIVSRAKSAAYANAAGIASLGSVG